MRIPLIGLLLIAAPLATAAERPVWQLELEQIMANPDWIGPPVEAPFWDLSGKRLLFQLKRSGSSLRDVWQVDIDGQRAASQVEDRDLAGIDAPRPVFSANGKQAVLIRNGDVFLRELRSGSLRQLLRELRSGSLRQLTRTADIEAMPGFLADGGGVFWRVDNQWFVHLMATQQTLALPAIKTEKAPDAKPDADLLREQQLRLIETLRKERADKELVAGRDKALRAVDPTRPPQPLYLGDRLVLTDSRLSPDGRHLVLVTAGKDADGDRGRIGKMPKYVTESGYEEVEDVRTRVGRNWPKGQNLWLADLATGAFTEIKFDPLPGIDVDPLSKMRKARKLEPLKGLRPLRVDGIAWHDSGRRVAVQLRSVDNKDRWIAEIDLKTNALQLRHRLTDVAWVNDGSSDNPTYTAFGWVPGSQQLWYLSEESGYSHLYVSGDRGKPSALTKGRWEATRPLWSRDGRHAYLLCNRRSPGDYEVCAVDAHNGKLSELSALDGVEEFALSPDESMLAVLHSSSFMPPQLALLTIADHKTQPLTDTRSATFRKRQFVAPQLVEVPSKHDAGVVHGKFYGPQTLESARRYPIVLFVHGAGYLQNVHTGWPAYFREQMFHDLLVRHGFLVLDLDYRGSAGYGRDWRTAIYRQMGHPELEDYLDGIDWLVDTQQGDRARVGIYGGSYGGFMTFMALFRKPEVFKAGAALRPVSDWMSYNHEYTANILNTPELDPEAYRKSSPIEYAADLQGQLLIAHGMIDDNVFFQDSVRLTQRLIERRLGGWELASYPLERHGYVHPESWYDQYRRIFELFERTLAGQ